MTRGGTKRKIEIAKRETTQQRSVTCSKRRKTVFSKAADLCLRGGANMAVFVDSPAEDSDVVYSFSGHSSASEIAHCYLNGKSPPPIPIRESDFGFLSEDPVDLYRNCDDLSELETVEDRYIRMQNEIVACIDRKRRLQQNPSFKEDKPCPQSQNPSAEEKHFPESFCFDQNPSTEEKPFTEIFCYDQNPRFEERSFTEIFCYDQNCSSEELPYTEIFSFDQNPTLEDKPCPESFCFDQNPSFEDKMLTESFYKNFSPEEWSFLESLSFDQNPSLPCLATEEEAAEAYAITSGGLNTVTNFEMNRYDVEALMNTFGALDSPCPSSSGLNLQQFPFESSVLYHHHNMIQHCPASTVQVPMWSNESY